jgi:hypothetical protein
MENDVNEKSSLILVSFPFSRSYLQVAVVTYGIDKVSGDVIVMANFVILIGERFVAAQTRRSGIVPSLFVTRER